MPDPKKPDAKLLHFHTCGGETTWNDAKAIPKKQVNEIVAIGPNYGVRYHQGARTLITSASGCHFATEPYHEIVAQYEGYPDVNLRALIEERAEAIAMAHALCEYEGEAPSFADALRLADIIEKHVFRAGQADGRAQCSREGEHSR